MLGGPRFRAIEATPPLLSSRFCVQPPKLMANEAHGAQVIAAECHKSQVSGRSLTEQLPAFGCSPHLLHKYCRPRRCSYPAEFKAEKKGECKVEQIKST